MPRGDELVWETQVPPDVSVEMDPHDFGEVMGNLLDNARKWAKTSVAVRVDMAGEKARITIEDDGPGFAGGPKGIRPERGMTGRSDTTSSGLGLGIVEDILAEYETTLNIDGGGRCRVSFEIPVCPEISVLADRAA
jgi:signal transduction histidine kinase